MPRPPTCTPFFPGKNASPSTFILVLCISYLDLKVFEYHMLSSQAFSLTVLSYPLVLVFWSTESVGPVRVILLDVFLLASSFFFVLQSSLGTIYLLEPKLRSIGYSKHFFIFFRQAWVRRLYICRFYFSQLLHFCIVIFGFFCSYKK